MPRERWLDLTPAEFAEELDAAAWREHRLTERAIVGAWFTEYYARVRLLPKLSEHLEQIFAAPTSSAAAAAEEAKRTAAAARAWNRLFAALGEQQEREHAALVE